MKLTSAEIYQLASEITEKEFTNLYNRLTDKEETLFNSLVKLGDRKEVALWTVVSERYEDKNTEFYQSAFNL